MSRAGARSLRRWAVASILLACCPVLVASSVVVETTSRPLPEKPLVKLYSGTLPAEAETVQPSPELTMLLLVDSTSAEQVPRLTERVLAVQDSLKGRPLRLAALRGGTLEVYASFTGRDKLRSALTSMAWPAADKVAGAAILDEIRQATPRLGTNFAQVLLVGDLPETDPAVQEYGASLLSQAFDAQRIRVSWLPGEDSSESWIALILARGGQVLGNDRTQYAAALSDQGKTFAQLFWKPTPPVQGFVAFRASIVDAQGQEFLAVPDLAGAPGMKYPDIVDFEWTEQRLQQLMPRLGHAPPEHGGAGGSTLDGATRDEVRSLLAEALEANPLDPQALRVGILYSLDGNDPSGAEFYGERLVAVRPQSGADFALYGHALVRSKKMVAGERALRTALRLGTRTDALYEDLAHARRAQRDPAEAAAFLGEALRINPRRQDLWFLRAELAAQIPDVPQAMESLEQGLTLGGVHVPEWSMLLTFYGESGAQEKQMQRLTDALAALPAQPEPRAALALALEAAHQNAVALRAWESVLELRPTDETARARKAALLEAQAKAQ